MIYPNHTPSSCLCGERSLRTNRLPCASNNGVVLSRTPPGLTRLIGSQTYRSSRAAQQISINAYWPYRGSQLPATGPGRSSPPSAYRWFRQYVWSLGCPSSYIIAVSSHRFSHDRLISFLVPFRVLASACSHQGVDPRP